MSKYGTAMCVMMRTYAHAASNRHLPPLSSNVKLEMRLAIEGHTMVAAVAAAATEFGLSSFLLLA